MSTENEAHGDEDCPVQPTARDYDLALEDVVETIMNFGQWPQRGKAEFDLYDFLIENRDPSYFLEAYISMLSGQTDYERIKRETNTVREMLDAKFLGSNIVETVALNISRGE